MHRPLNRRPRPPRCSVLAGALLLVASALPAHDTGRHLSDEQLVARAGYVVLGRVTDLRSEWNADRTQIFTFVEVTVERELKGSVPQPTVNLRLLGGTVDNVTMTVLTTPPFAIDEEVFLFLAENYRSLFPLVGVHEGKVSVRFDEDTSEEIAEAGHRPTLPRADFEERIERLIAELARAPRAEIAPTSSLPVIEPKDGGES